MLIGALDVEFKVSGPILSINEYFPYLPDAGETLGSEGMYRARAFYDNHDLLGAPFQPISDEEIKKMFAPRPLTAEDLMIKL